MILELNIAEWKKAGGQSGPQMEKYIVGLRVPFHEPYKEEKPMKKIIVLILALALCLGIAQAEETIPPQEDASALLGDWYGTFHGVPVQLTFREDGAYTAAYPGLPESAQEGVWRLEDGFVFLNGDDSAPLSLDGDRLSRRSLGLYFTREQAAYYVPADPDPTAPLEAFAGAWHSVYVMGNGGAWIPADLAEEDARIYVEQARAALVEKRVGEKIVDFVFENGALTGEGDGFSLSLQMQQDSLLRLTLTANGETVSLICAPFLVEGLYPEAEAAE